MVHVLGYACVMSDTVSNVTNQAGPSSAPTVVFSYKDIYLVDLKEVISVQPNPVKDQVAIQMRHGAYTVWHDVDDAVEAARQLNRAKMSIPGVEVVDYEPPRRAARP